MESLLALAAQTNPGLFPSGMKLDVVGQGNSVSRAVVHTISALPTPFFAIDVERLTLGN